jgi:hypothetical protein
MPSQTRRHLLGPRLDLHATETALGQGSKIERDILSGSGKEYFLGHGWSCSWLLGKGILPCLKTVAIMSFSPIPKILAVYPMNQHSKFKSPSMRSYPMTSNQRPPTSDVSWNPQPSAFKPSSKFTLNEIVPVRPLENFTHISSCHVTSRQGH